MEINKYIISIIYVCSLLQYTTCKEDKEEEGGLGKVGDILFLPLPMPCYIPQGMLFSFGSIFFIVPPIICNIIMYIPFPKIFFLHRFLVVGLGIYLIAMHAIGIIFGDSFITQIAAVLLGAFCALSGLFSSVSVAPLLVIGVYMIGYLLAALLSLTSFLAFLVLCAITFAALSFVKVLIDSFYFVVIKTSLTLFCVLLGFELLTPFNLISTIHGKGGILAGAAFWISKIIIVVGGIGFFFFNYFLTFMCG